MICLKNISCTPDLYRVKFARQLLINLNTIELYVTLIKSKKTPLVFQTFKIKKKTYLYYLDLLDWTYFK